MRCETGWRRSSDGRLRRACSPSAAGACARTRVATRYRTGADTRDERCSDRRVPDRRNRRCPPPIRSGAGPAIGPNARGRSRCRPPETLRDGPPDTDDRTWNGSGTETRAPRSPHGSARLPADRRSAIHERRDADPGRVPERCHARPIGSVGGTRGAVIPSAVWRCPRGSPAGRGWRRRGPPPRRRAQRRRRPHRRRSGGRHTTWSRRCGSAPGQRRCR